MIKTSRLTTYWSALLAGSVLVGGCVTPDSELEDWDGLEANDFDDEDLDAEPLELIDEELPSDETRPGDGATDELTDEPDVSAANYNISFDSAPDGLSATVGWDTAAPPVTYDVCWKPSGESGDVCAAPHMLDDFEVLASNSGYSPATGRQFVGIGPLECETEYKIRIKRSGIIYDTEFFTTSACTCDNPCPSGGSYDGANCQIGQAPAGTTAFIYGGNYYYTALSGNSCPYPGSWYDGANCYVQPVPAGVTPFIWANNWYYADCP